MQQKKQQGFEDSDNEHLTSKAKENPPGQSKTTQDFFKIPDAKPILSKNIIDINKPIVLIREINIYKEPPQLLSSNVHKQIFSADKNHLGKNYPNLKNVEDTNLWNKYILSQKFTSQYLKYYREDIRLLQKKGFKRYKSELQRLCRNTGDFFASYFIDLSFMSDMGTYLLRNLKTQTFQSLQSKPQQYDVEFDSKFQCGNLFAVFKKNQNNSPKSNKIDTNGIYQVDLVLQSDINTKGYSNWFYFSVKSKQKQKFKFNIVNMQKYYSLFTAGMKVVVFSQKRQEKQGLEWHRDGYEYMYYPNQLLKSQSNNSKYNTLSFCYDQKYQNDLIFFAANLPYSYSKLLKYIDGIEKTAKLNSNIYFKRQVIASTISSNQCPVLTLTWKRDKKSQIKKKKKIIGVLARQHPCETVSSYVMEGFINSLVQMNHEFSVYLLQNYIFKIVPMVNIDGVIYGNSRCDISGTDVNRKWTRNPHKMMYPVVSAIRNLFNRLKIQDYQIDYFLDLHGHSRKLGSFFYGCKNLDQIQSRQTAWIMSRLNSKFCFEDCTFGLNYLKRDTARGSMSESVIKKKSMTLEASFYGYKNISNRHFQVKDLQKIGYTLAETLYTEQSRDPKMLNWDIMKSDIRQIVASLKKAKKKNENLEQDSEGSGSDSNPEEDEMTQKQRNQLFLDPVVAAKIGLIEMKVVEKKKSGIRRKEEKQKLNDRNKYDPIIDGFNERIGELVQIKSTTFEPVSIKFKERQQQKKPSLSNKQAKSVTKIAPFTFSESRKSLSIERRVRKPIDLIQTKTQKLSNPDIPSIEYKKKNNFLQSLRNQIQGLIKENVRKENNFYSLKRNTKY